MSRFSARRTLYLALVLALSGAATATLVPVNRSIHAIAPDLDSILPERFGHWTRAPLGPLVLPAEKKLAPGEAVAYRAYRNKLGRIVTLVVAYGPPLGDSVRLHRPEKCYRAQGFEILGRNKAEIELDGRVTQIVHLETQSPEKAESVTYLLREGAQFTTSAAENPIERLLNNAAAPLDGALIRVSTNSLGVADVGLQEGFLEEFASALSPEGRRLLLGSTGRQS